MLYPNLDYLTNKKAIFLYKKMAKDLPKNKMSLEEFLLEISFLIKNRNQFSGDKK